MQRRRLLVSMAGAAALGALAARMGGEGLAAGVGAALLGAALPLHSRAPRAGQALIMVAVVLTLASEEIRVASTVLLGLNAFCVGRYADGALRLVTGILVTVGVQLRVHAEQSAPDLFIVLGPLLAGWALAQRDLITRQLAARGTELDAEREVFAALSVRHERARIAAELHDIVAHAISIMVVQASAGQRLAAVDAGLTEEAFAVIGGAARHAETEMGRLVALLTDADQTTEDPDLAFVAELVARAAGTGLDVTLRLEGDRGLLPSEVSRSAYLVVREGLTNALRYASGAPVRILVNGGTDEVLIEVVNDPAPRSAPLAGHGSGSGLRGLRERLDAYGGRLDAGATGDGGWQLRAQLPRRAAIMPAATG